MNEDTAGRLDYLARTVDVLWPNAPLGTSMVVLPSARAPRLLAPKKPRRAAASAVVRYTAQQGARDRMAGGVLAAAVAAGYAATRPPVSARVGAGDAESIDDHLSRVLGHPVVTSLALTRDRPNRKPVLQVFDTRGRTVAFAKVGIGDLAAALVRTESATLRRLMAAGLRTADVPRVLSDDAWNGYPILVTSPLATGAAIASDAPSLGTAMREVAAIGNSSTVDYLAQLRERACRAEADDPAIREWRDTFELVAATRDLDGVPSGSWHGDWTPWNCSRHAGRVLVWDWERFTEPAPRGFDLLHYVLNNEVGSHRDRFHARASALVARASELLAPWNLAAADAQTVALLYLLDIALRYLCDDARTTDAGGRVEEWALPTVRAHVGAAR